MRRVFAAFVLGCALLAGVSLASGEERVVIASHDLGKAVSDDSTLIGKIVQVNGVVLSTGISRFMTPNVMLSDIEGGQVQVICVLPRLDAAKLSDFKPGQSVTMLGRVLKVTERGVLLKESRLIE